MRPHCAEYCRQTVRQELAASEDGTNSELRTERHFDLLPPYTKTIHLLAGNGSHCVYMLSHEDFLVSFLKTLSNTYDPNSRTLKQLPQISNETCLVKIIGNAFSFFLH